MTMTGIRRSAAIAVVTLLGVLATVGVGFAAIPSADKVIHTCYRNDPSYHGALRVVDTEAGNTCGQEEMPLNFGTATVHWARVDKDGRMTAKSSENVYTGWFDTGGYYFGASGLDLSKCGISITPDRRHPNDAPASAEIYETYSSYTMFYMKRIKPSVWPLVHERVNTAFHISAMCT